MAMDDLQGQIVAMHFCPICDNDRIFTYLSWRTLPGRCSLRIPARHRYDMGNVPAREQKVCAQGKQTAPQGNTHNLRTYNTRHCDIRNDTNIFLITYEYRALGKAFLLPLYLHHIDRFS